MTGTATITLTTMATITGTTTEVQPALLAHSFLQLMWLASPALPIGGFSYSEGLEAAINASLVTTESEAGDWLAQQLHLSQSRGEMAVIAQAASAWQATDLPRIAELNQWVRTTRESSELRLQTEQMGRSLVEWLRNRHAGQVSILDTVTWLAAQDASYPIAFSFAAHCAGASAHDALLAYAFGWAENLVQAAVKAVPLGQSAGQRILARLAQEIPQAVACALALPDDARQAFSPMLAILSAQHEHQYSRLFRS
ncbi:urease accessory protein UreF [Comamonas odontotermitis]|uniref:urease accessory protein UreF n=2 Tax=Comamonas odontotermitis TaxID=379895 RepID=UPI001CC77DE9|nr:urease accessory UreF family protein [Comamonas odontotermitis]UBB17834.1 urease accessory protein UreF [Comamonas odontotermitis]